MANPEMQEQFVRTGGKPAPRPKRARAINSTLPAKSEQQEELDKRWESIRFSFLMCQLRSGGYHCHGCGLVVESPTHLDLDHIENRNKNNYNADNAQLLCNARSANGNDNCHDAKHGNQPQWSHRD